jgi:hypothetical protein
MRLKILRRGGLSGFARRGKYKSEERRNYAIDLIYLTIEVCNNLTVVFLKQVNSYVKCFGTTEILLRFLLLTKIEFNYYLM